MNKKPNFYAIIPATVRYDEGLSSSQKLFYAEITAMSQKEGYCWASNSYFSELYGVANSTVSSWVTGLKDNGHIVVEYEKTGKNIDKRLIYPIQKIDYPYSENQNGVFRKSEGGYSENPKENSTSNNTTSNNNYVQFVEYWNEVNDCNLRITDSKRTQIRARLNTYTEEELKIAIRNRSEDSWINGEGKKYKTNWDSFWRNDEKPERYLNAQESEKQFDPSKSAYFS